MRAWIARSGKAGERERWILDKGYTGGGFAEVENLTDANTRELASIALARALPALKDAVIRIFANHLWARWAVSCRRATSRAAEIESELTMGRINGDYQYLAGVGPVGLDAPMFVVSVKSKITQVGTVAPWCSNYMGSPGRWPTRVWSSRGAASLHMSATC